MIDRRSDQLGDVGVVLNACTIRRRGRATRIVVQYTRCRRLRQVINIIRKDLQEEGREEEVRDERNAGNWKLDEMRPPRTGMLAAAVIPNRR